MIYAIIILSVALGVSFWVNRNQLKKNEKMEDILAGYLQYLDTLSKIIELSDEKLKHHSLREHFESDDEIGFFFRQIKDIQEVLNEFNVKEIATKNGQNNKKQEKEETIK